MKPLYLYLSAFLLLLLHCTPAKEENSTQESCSTYDLTPFLKTPEAYGAQGVFDTMYQRIQFHFETIRKTGDCTYAITGADRLKGLVTPFSGEIHVQKIIRHAGNLYSPETPAEDQLMDFYGGFEFREDTSVAGSGVFKGRLTFSLTLNRGQVLTDDLADYMGDGFSNFSYEGTWTSYTSGKEKTCIWGEGRLPNTGDFDVGAGQVVPHEKYRKYGWELDQHLLPVDNPRQWWKK